jgi:hypothetical protein
MSRAARRLIEAIQHLLLGSLLMRLLWPNLFWAMFLVQWSTRDGPQEQQGEDAVAGIIAIWLLTALLAWLLGAVARPAYRSPDLSIPSNGFEVWSRTPPGGLRPPSPFRALLRLAEAWPKRLNPLALAVGLSCLFVVWLLAALPDQAARLHPGLSDPQLRSTVIVVSFALFVLIDLTAWARQQAARLAPA